MAAVLRCICDVPPVTAGRPSDGLLDCRTGMDYAVKALQVKQFSQPGCHEARWGAGRIGPPGPVGPPPCLAGGVRFVDNPPTASQGGFEIGLVVRASPRAAPNRFAVKAFLDHRARFERLEDQCPGPGPPGGPFGSR